MTGSRLTAESVVRRYGRREALRGVSLDVRPGELFGLVGPNGAGKTTLLSTLAGLSDADAGTVTLDGEPLTPRSNDLRRRVGLATQDLAVYPELTARENIDFFGRLYGLRGRDLARRVDEVLADVALADRADHRVGTFSGGMKRRLNLAAAVVHRPTILLLDEPTTGVDPQSRNHIFDRVRDLNAAGLTVVYTSHYMEEVQALCPRVLILDHGQVIATDGVPALLRRLPTVANITLASPAPPALVAELRERPGVAACRPTPAGLALDLPDPGPALAGVLEASARHGATVTGLTLDPPTLERVFLSLTGVGLRD